MPIAVVCCLNGPAVGLAWLWHAAGLPPHSEAAFAMPLVFGFAQWFAAGALVGLWRHRRGGKPREAEPGASPNGGPAVGSGNSGAGGGPPSVS